MNQARKVELLDPHTINQIAAGEVVERPASALKELVENSLDAGASRIVVDLEKSGKALMKVVDDGHGMSSEDMGMALLRHATSKIRRVEDLHHVESLGFRGEALPSIASVSRLSLKSATDHGIAHQIDVEYGQITHSGPVSGLKGTEVLVRDLFGNTPARLKFLKSDTVELGACMDAVSRLAMSHPEVGFLLRHGGREVFRTDGSGNLYEAISGIWSREIASGLARVDGEVAGIRLEGYVSPPYLTKPTRAFQFLYVNGRSVKSRSLTIALDQAYRDMTPERRFPLIVLNLQVNPEWIDVNVSPTKSEVRFQREGAVFEALRVAIRSALLEQGMIPNARAVATVNEALANLAQKSSFGMSTESQTLWRNGQEESNRVRSETGFLGDGSFLPGHLGQASGGERSLMEGLVGSESNREGFEGILNGGSSVPTTGSASLAPNFVSTGIDAPLTGSHPGSKEDGGLGFLGALLDDGFERAEVADQAGQDVRGGNEDRVGFQDVNGPKNNPFNGSQIQNRDQSHDRDQNLVQTENQDRGQNRDRGQNQDVSRDQSKDVLRDHSQRWDQNQVQNWDRDQDFFAGALEYPSTQAQGFKTQAVNLSSATTNLEEQPLGQSPSPSLSPSSSPSPRQPFLELLDGLRVIGQAMKTFILAETAKGIIIIDQHVAHERILYERLYQQRGRGALETQPLLAPLVLAFDKRTLVLLGERIDEVREAGFEVEPFGASGELLVRAVPAVMRSKDPAKLVRSLVEDIAEGVARHRTPTCEQVWAMASCKMAVKAGDPLSIAEMTKLIEDLAITENPYLCPHGRPITVTLDGYQLLKLFKRV